jgi:oxygen-independent coproporphyrinogen-3 oxidase
LGVYVHWPFCKSKCPYCDFNSHVREGVDQARWQRALLDRTRARRARGARPAGRDDVLRRRHALADGAETVGALIARTRQLWDSAPDIEITLEANPTSVESARFAALAEAGVNRVSLGVQALDPAALSFLGREHSADEALEAIATARAISRAIRST